MQKCINRSKIVLAVCVRVVKMRGMVNDITPQEIEAKALDARLSITEVLRRAKVSRGAYYRWRRGEGDMLPLTKMRLLDVFAEKCA